MRKLWHWYTKKPFRFAVQVWIDKQIALGVVHRFDNGLHTTSVEVGPFLIVLDWGSATYYSVL